jgi:hypothetical protein
MNTDIEHDDTERGPHGTLTLKRLIALCCVGIICWVGIIQCAVKLYEVLS